MGQRITATLDAFTSDVWRNELAHFANSNPGVGTPEPGMVMRAMLRDVAAMRGFGPKATAPASTPIAANVEEPAVAAAPAEPPPVEVPPVVAAAPAPRKSSRSPKAIATPKPSKASGKSPKTRTPAAPLASAEDVARIGRYLSGYPNAPGVLNGGKLAIAAGVPRQRSSLFKVQAAAKAGEKLPGMQAETAVAVLAYLDAQGEVARVSQETTGQ